MGDLEGFENNINQSLDKIDREISSLLKKDQTAKKSSYKKIENWLSSTNTIMQSYDLEITELDNEDQGEHKEKLKAFTVRLEKLRQQYELKKQEGTVDLYDGARQQNQDVSQMTCQEMIELGDRTQAQGDEALENIERMVNEGIEIGNKINEDLDRQIEQLDRLYDTVKDTQSELKRSQKYLKYFAKNLYTDKIVMCLIFLVLCGIIALIVLSAMGYGSTSKSPTQTEKINNNDSGTDSEVTQRFLLGFLQQDNYT